MGWAELYAWKELTGTFIDPEESRMLIAMNRAYVSANHETQKAFKERSEAIKKATGKQ